MGLIKRMFSRVIDDMVDSAVEERLQDKTIEQATEKSAASRTFELGDDFAISLFGGRSGITDPFTQIPSVFKAVRAITDNVPQADIRFYKKTDLDGQPVDFEKLDKNLIRLFTKPNESMNIKVFFQYCAGFLALNGEFIIIKNPSKGQVAGSTNSPAELIIDSPTKFKEKKENKVRTGWTYTVNQTFYPNDQIIFSRDFNSKDINRGISPNIPLKTILETDHSSRNFNKKFFDNDATPSVALQTDKTLSEKARVRLAAWWKKNFQGVKNAFKAVVLEDGLKVSPMGSTHKDMEFLDQSKYTREEILGTYRVPKALFNITEDLNYATFVGQMKVFWLYTLAPILRKIEYAMNVELVSQIDDTLVMRFDFSNVPAFKEDFADKVETATQLFNMGFPINDINNRLQLGMSDTAWGNQWWIPFSTVPAGAIPQGNDDPTKIVKENKKGVDPAKVERLFRSRHDKIERPFEVAIKKYFFQQRKLILEEIDEINKSITKISWLDQDDKLIKVSLPFITDSVRQGAEIGHIISQIETNEIIMSGKLTSMATERAKQITRINETVKNQLNASINAGLAEGETVAQIADRVRDIYNVAGNRSKLIARTETTAAMNDASQAYYKQVGVTEKQWVTAMDERVRESHQMINGETVPINSGFSNGVTVPGVGGIASETINCRCTVVPIVPS